MDRLTKHLTKKSDPTFGQREGLLGAGTVLVSAGMTTVNSDKWYIGIILIILGLSALGYRAYLKK